MNLQDDVERISIERPDCPAVIDVDRDWNFRDFHHAVRGVASQFETEGIGRGDRVGVALGNTAGHLICIYALARLGAVACPLEVRTFGVQLAALCARLGIRRLAVAPETELPQPHPASEILVIDITRSGTRSPSPAPGGEAPFELTFSSGTTGEPKPFLISHRLQEERLETFAHLGIGGQDRYLALIGLGNDMGLRCAMAALRKGGSVALVRTPCEIRDLIHRSRTARASWTYLVPGHVRAMLQYPFAEESQPLGHFRNILVAGARLWPDERSAAIRLLCPGITEVYGANEVGIVTATRPGKEDPDEGTVGRPVEGFAVEVVDDAGRKLPPGVDGHVRFRGPGRVAGYLDLPEATSRSFREGWFHPGDIGHIDEGGRLHFVGRSDDQINVGGFKFYPAEIEAVLRTHPAVRDCVVLGWKRGRIEVPAAFVEVAVSVGPDELLAHCRARLAPMKLPGRILFRDSLPRSPTGKIRRQVLLASLRK